MMPGGMSLRYSGGKAIRIVNSRMPFSSGKFAIEYARSIGASIFERKRQRSNRSQASRYSGSMSKVLNGMSCGGHSSCT